MHHKMTAALVAALALGIASCGSSKSASTTSAQTSTTTTTATKPANQTPFAAQVDAVCQQADQGIAGVLKTARQSDPATARAKATGFLRTEVSSLEALKAPAKVQSEYALYKASVRARLELINGKAAKPTTNAKEIDRLERQHRAVRRIGLTKCF
jgi:hypothetical protein